MTLKNYYQDLDTINPQKKFKDEVIKHCRISDKTFYNWLNNEALIPAWAAATIEDVKNDLKELAL